MFSLSDYLTLEQVLEQLFRDDHPNQACHIAVIPQAEVDTVEVTVIVMSPTWTMRSKHNIFHQDC